MLQAPHMGNLLTDFIKKKRLYQSAWARDAGISATTIAYYLKQPTMRVDTLYAISQQLQHNFLRDKADTLPPQLPPQAPIDQSAELAAPKAENEKLKIEIAALERAIGLMGKQ